MAAAATTVKGEEEEEEARWTKVPSLVAGRDQVSGDGCPHEKRQR